MTHKYLGHTFEIRSVQGERFSFVLIDGKFMLDNSARPARFYSQSQAQQEAKRQIDFLDQDCM